MDNKNDFIEYGPITKSEYKKRIRQEVLEIYGSTLKLELGYIDDKIIDKITSIYTDPGSWIEALR